MHKESFALELLEHGYDLTVTVGKAPLFRGWQTRSPAAAEVLFHLRRGRDYGIKLEGLVCIDRDGANRTAYDWTRHWRVHRSPFEIETNKGVHILFRLAEGTENARTMIRHLGLPLDVLTGGNRQIVGPGVDVNGKVRVLRPGCRIVPRGELPECPSGIFAIRREVRTSTELVVSDDRKVESARRALARRSSIAGQGGDMALFKAACMLIQFYKFPFDAALELLSEWNAGPNVSPPWSVDRLTYKLREAERLMR